MVGLGVWVWGVGWLWEYRGVAMTFNEYLFTSCFQVMYNMLVPLDNVVYQYSINQASRDA